MADELNPTLVPEIGESVAPGARESGAWVSAYAKKQMDDFASAVSSNAKAATTASTSATAAAKATAADVSKTQAAVGEAGQKVEQARAQVELAEVQVQKASLESLTATEKAKTAAEEADRAEAAADRAEQIVRDFNPWINQYGYSKVISVDATEYRVTEADVGKTLLFKRSARLILPASGRTVFPECFFFHVTTANETDEVWIDYDPTTKLTLPDWHLPLVSGCERGTIQLLEAGHWRLYSPLVAVGADELCAKTAGSWVGQSHGQTHVRENLDGNQQLALTKQFGKLFVWAMDLVGGNAYNLETNALKVIDLPDGPLEFIYSSQNTFAGKVLFGVYGSYDTLTTSFGWYWGDSGFTGNIYPLTFEGYLPNDWYITNLNASVASPIKSAWVEFSSKKLKDANGKPVTHSRVFTSSDGYSWFVNRYSSVNAKIGTNKLLAHFVLEDSEKGDLYVELASNGEVHKYSYALTPGTWTDELIASGVEDIVSCKYWSATRSYGLILRDSGELTFVFHSAQLNSTKYATYPETVRSAVRTLGDSPRVPSCCVFYPGKVEAVVVQWVIDEARPNGAFLETELVSDTFVSTDQTELLVQGEFVLGVERTVPYAIVRDYDAQQTWVWWKGQQLPLPWNDCVPLAAGKYKTKAGGYINAVFSNLGIHFDLNAWNVE